MTLEAARTSKVWYSHSLYSDGYTYQGNLIGDAMGNNAERYYIRFNHYHTSLSRLTFHLEYLVMDQDASYPQSVQSFWVSYHRPLEQNFILNTSAGVAHIKNLDYQADNTDQNFLFSLELQKKF